MFRWIGRRRQRNNTDDLPNNLVTVLDPSSTASEAYRTLRTNLLYAAVDAPPKVILVSSSESQEGKSTTCANLGVALAQLEKSVLIIDGDLRRPAMHKIFGMNNALGLVNVLVGERDLEDSWQEAVPGLKILTAGSASPNPAELLSSQRYAELLVQAKNEFDFVLIDAPPVGPVSDPAILATHSDGVLLVVDAQSTRKAAIRRSLKEFGTVGARVLGTVMNNVEDAGIGYYGGYMSSGAR